MAPVNRAGTWGLRFQAAARAVGGIGLIALAQNQQGLGVGPFGEHIIVIGGEQFLQGAVIAGGEQPGRQDMAQTLIVVGVEAQHIPVMADGRSALARRPQAFGETGAGAHVRAGLQKAPEVAGITLEGLRPKRPFPGGNAGLIMAPRLDEGLRLLFRQQHMSVGAEVGYLQRPFGQFDPFAFGARVPGFVHEFLGLPKRRVITVASVKAGGQPAGELGHHPLQSPTVGQRRRGLGHRLEGRFFLAVGAAFLLLLRRFLLTGMETSRGVHRRVPAYRKPGLNACVLLRCPTQYSMMDRVTSMS